MDAKVDDFFNEINEIVPPKDVTGNGKQEHVWKECYDELTGYSYYWNTKTDQVTWNTPSDYKSKTKSSLTNKKKPNLYIPPKETTFPSTKIQPVKIYSIGECSNNPEVLRERNPPNKKPYKHTSDSEDEKIELITSYGSDSESDREPEIKRSKSSNSATTKILDDSYASDDDDDVDILTKIQKRAQQLKQEKSSNKLLQTTGNTEARAREKTEPAKNTPGFSLVAGYTDSEEEEDNEELKVAFAKQPEMPQVSHSTLFPITKPIDIKDFIPNVEEDPKPAANRDFDSKAFQRKKRIGVALVNTAKKKENISDLDGPKKGLGGFGNDTQSENTSKIYPGFTKGGVMFVKSDVLNPSLPISTADAENVEKRDEPVINKDEVNDMYFTLKEKLGFLNVGRPDMSPVQTMLIQAETLFLAMKEGGLKLSYLQKWLQETCSELIKLEGEATPEGWLLQWDRLNKRYYYRHLATGVSQWEYPCDGDALEEPDDAMDISTTPPPSNEPTIHDSPPPPPLPPSIRSPTPPPPPIISGPQLERDELSYDVPLLPEPIEPQKLSSNGQPLPPGVDLPEIITYTKPEIQEEVPPDPLNSALDSFYSHIAAITNMGNLHFPTSPQPPPPPPLHEKNQGHVESDAHQDTTKKRKKAKVKLAPGLTMKKKGVSQLVEKWKNVQQHYND